MDRHSPIAVFDSGLGGISILRELVTLMPKENYIYYGDSLNAPYGTKSPDEVRRLSEAVAEKLVTMGAKALVVACNTATSAAIASLRRMYPHIPVVGLEPAVKPAALSAEHPTVLVMATELTLREQKYLRLAESYQGTAKLIHLPAPKLVEFVERGELCGDAIDGYLAELTAPYTGEHIDAVVLGCTHFPFVADAVKKAVGDDVKLFDGGAGAARETRHLLEARDLLTDSIGAGTVRFMNSSPDEGKISRSRRLFEIKTNK